MAKRDMINNGLKKDLPLLKFKGIQATARLVMTPALKLLKLIEI